MTRIPLNNGLSELTDERGRRSYKIISNTSIGLSAGTMFGTANGKFFHTIEGKFEQNKACYTFQEPFSYQFAGAISNNWVMFDKYLNYGLAYQFTFTTGGMMAPDFLYVRGAFSQSFFHRDDPPEVTTLGTTRDYTENGTGLISTTTQTNRLNTMISFEFGARVFSEDYDRAFDYGIVGHFPLKPSYTEQYEFFQNNNSLGKSEHVYVGSTVMFSVRYTFCAKPKEKIDTTSQRPDVYVQTDTSREVDVQESFEVHNKRVRIRVWDRNEVDGDVVTLSMNNELIRKNLKLRKRKKSFTVKLKPGSNILVMYAENLGDIPPNTAALEIKDGKKKRNVNLVSDNGKSGAVELIYMPK